MLEHTTSPGLDKMARDSDGDGLLDKAVIIIAVDEAKTAKEVIEKTQQILDNISQEKKPCEYDQNGDPDRSSSDYQCSNRVLIQTVLADFPISNCTSCIGIIRIPL